MKNTFVRTVVATVVVILFVIAMKFFWEAYAVSADATVEPISVIIDKGSSVRRIASEFQENGIIKSPFLFEAYVRLRGLSASLPAGTFSLKRGSSFSKVTAVLLETRAAGVQVTIPEGYTLQKIWDTLHVAFPNLNEADFFTAVGKSSKLKKAIPILSHLSNTQDLEGYLFPDTYLFAQDASAETIVRIMVETLARRLSETGIGKSGKNLHEFLTLASIIEREVRRMEDMANVADIFFRRLKIGMALQADSTVNYAINGKNPALTSEEMRTDTPYNTYLYRGLPPGPICNPGMNAINATANPTKNSWMYFLTTPSGDVKYARTFEEHVANKNRYLR